MSKKSICQSNPAFAYYSGFSGLELHHIEYGINDYIYCVSGAWGGGKAFHRLKVYYANSGDYIRLHGYEVPLADCIRMGA